MKQTQATSSSLASQSQPSYEGQRDQCIAAKHEALVKERGIPLWMLTGFPAVSDEPDEDDDVAFEEG